MTDEMTNPEPEDSEDNTKRLASEDPGKPDAHDTEGHRMRGGVVEDDDDTDGHMSRI